MFYRWWFEQIGFWGAPGTAPSDETAPIGILAINVPAENSPDAYKSRYPNGYTAPYSTASSPIAAVVGSGMSTLVLSVFIFLAGVGIGGGAAMLIVKNRGPYTPLN